MYTVMIVDDEPAAVKFLASIIEKYCPTYTVAATAGNGEEALCVLKEQMIDVVCFDIRMPVMSGITFSERVREEGLMTLMVAVSGYAEFEYAKQTMKNGVVDYIVKPVIPREMKVLFDRLAVSLGKIYWERRNIILKTFGKGEAVSDKEIAHYFGEGRFYLAVARRNGIPKQFTPFNSQEIFSEPYEMVYAYGRDEQESLYIWSDILVGGEEIRDTVLRRVKKDFGDSGYTTLVYKEEAVEAADFMEVIQALYRELFACIVLGENRVKKLGEQENAGNYESLQEKSLTKKLMFTQEYEDKSYKSLLKDLLVCWKDSRAPLCHVERGIYALLTAIQLEYTGRLQMSEAETVLNDFFQNGTSYAQLESLLGELILPGERREQSMKIDTPAFVEQVCTYVDLHMKEELSAYCLADIFSVSANYLGQLFKKYRNTTINRYVTSVRMERAKQILAAHKEILIRELASMVGYEDQFYFSRVFKAYTGMSPTEYHVSSEGD